MNKLQRRICCVGLFFAILTLLAMITLQSCSSVQRTKRARSAPTIEKLKNAEYQSEYMAGGTAKLTNGLCREKIVEDSALEVIVRLTGRVAFGELDSGLDAAAVILKTETGGSGTFTDLAVVIDNEGIPENIASIFLGDRVKVQRIAIENGRIVLQIIAHGPHDPMCCPTLEITKKSELRSHELIELPPEK